MANYFEGTSDSDLIVEKGGWDSKINAGAGNDTISESSGRVSINAGAGDDSVYSYNYYQTVVGGLGSDTINLTGVRNVIQYANGDGNDILLAWHETDTVHLTDSNNYNAAVSGDDVVLSAGNGKMTLKNAKGRVVSVKDKDNKLTRRIFDGKSTITPISGEAYSTNNSGGVSASNSVVSGTNNADVIYNAGYRVTVEAGNGNDTIRNFQSEVVLSGGNGNDWLYTDDYHVTMNGGRGDDTISLLVDQSNRHRHENIIYYAPGDGNDTIINYDDSGSSWGDTIQIASSSYTTTTSGKDAIITVGDGSMRLVDAANKKLYIVTVQPAAAVPAEGWATITSAGNPKIVAYSENTASGADTDDTITTKAISDTVRSVYSKEGNDLIFVNAGNEICGISRSTVTLDSGNGNDSIGIIGGVDGIHPATVNVNCGAGDDIVSIYGGNEGIHGGTTVMTSDQKSLISIEGGAGNDKIIIHGSADKGIDISRVTINGGAGNDLISITGGKYGIGGVEGFGGATVSVSGGDGADTISIGAIDALSTVSIVAGAGDLINTGLGKATYVFDSKEKATINGMEFVASSVNSAADLEAGSGMTLQNTWSGTVAIAAGGVLTDINGKYVTAPGTYQIVNGAFVENKTDPSGDTIKTDPSNDTIKTDPNSNPFNNPSYYQIQYQTINIYQADTKNVWFNGFDPLTGQQTSYSEQFSSILNINASQWTTRGIVTGNNNDNVITASNVGSSLWGGGKGNNTLIGGNSGDMFWFTGSGNDVVQNFTAGTSENSDVLTLFGTSLTSMRRENNFMTFDTANGTKLQVNNSASSDEAIKYSTDGTNVSCAKVGYTEQNNSFTYEDGVNFYAGGNHTDVLKVNQFEGKNIWLDGSQGKIFSNVNNIDASASQGNNTLAGDGGDNQIAAGSGNDSLWGGSGRSADTLVGGNGSDMFWYGKNDGADVINNASSNDVVNLYDVSLSDISSVNYRDKTISATFAGGGNLQINSAENISSTFQLAEGRFKYNHTSGEWQNA